MKLVGKISYILLILFLTSCLSTNKLINMDGESGDKTTLPVDVKILIEMAEYCEEIIENHALEETIILTGHSLGGAISQIIGLWLEDDAYDVQIFTYGSPTITTASLGRDPIHFRVAIRNDPVPFLPPFPYKHWGIKINAETLDWSENHEIEDVTKIDARDHSIKEYLKVLRRHESISG